jgi:hypothetical protein
VNPLLPILAPIVVMLPGLAGMGAAHRMAPRAFDMPSQVTPPPPVPQSIEPVVPPKANVTTDATAPARQVSIEQRITIRVSPRNIVPAALVASPLDAEATRTRWKKMGKCLPMASIAGVQATGDKLVLYLRDNRIVSATLEKACRAADFYSGFYVARSGDGKLCAGRDELLSRSGSNCQVSGLRQLVVEDD